MERKNDLYMDLLHANTGLLFDDSFDSYCITDWSKQHTMNHWYMARVHLLIVDCTRSGEWVDEIRSMQESTLL